MFKHLQYLSRQVTVAAVALFVGISAQAENQVSTRFVGGSLQASTNVEHAGATMTISGPNGYYVTQRGASVSSLRTADVLEDGVYKYEITLVPAIKRTRKDGGADTMGHKRTPGSISSGSFRVVNGVPVNTNIQEETGGQQK